MPDFYGELDLPSVSEIQEKKAPDTLIDLSDPLKLELEDEELIRVINERINASNAFFNDKLFLKDRRAKNKEYYLGAQLNLTQLKTYNARYTDNLIYEAESTIKPIAMSRLPDLIVKPGNETEESKKSADDLTKVVNNDLRKRENRKVLGLAFKHLPIFLTGVLKAVWDPQKGDNGDYRFKTVHPDNIVMDHTAMDNDTEEMDFIAEATEQSIKEILMRFPNKSDDLLSALKFTDADKQNEKKLASKIKIWEVWFTWWDSSKDDSTGEMKWERIEGVVWKYDQLVLGKMRNPYWDWEGKKRQLNEEEMRKLVFGDDEDVAGSDVFYFNHFKDPQKPYFFMGYDQLGEHPVDATSRIEQVLLMQDNVNKRGRQITQMNDRAKGKHVSSVDSGLDKAQIEDMDMADPDEDILVDGDLRAVHTFIPGTPAPAQLHQEQELERNKAFAKMGAHSTTRGEMRTDVATTNQILREADFGKIDDLVEETINPAAEWIANWTMQFIKLFYTKEHMRKILGDDGEVTFTRIDRDLIEDGMEVIVSASGVDKIERKREAFERARLKLTDPLTFFVDTDSNDPIGRSDKLMTFLLSPELYHQKFVLKRDTAEMGQQLNQEPVQAAPEQAQQQQAQPQPVPAGAGGGNPNINQMSIPQLAQLFNQDSRFPGANLVGDSSAGRSASTGFLGRGI